MGGQRCQKPFMILSFSVKYGGALLRWAYESKPVSYFLISCMPPPPPLFHHMVISCSPLKWGVRTLICQPCTLNEGPEAMSFLPPHLDPPLQSCTVQLKREKTLQTPTWEVKDRLRCGLLMFQELLHPVDSLHFFSLGTFPALTEPWLKEVRTVDRQTVKVKAPRGFNHNNFFLKSGRFKHQNMIWVQKSQTQIP